MQQLSRDTVAARGRAMRKRMKFTQPNKFTRGPTVMRSQRRSASAWRRPWRPIMGRSPNARREAPETARCRRQIGWRSAAVAALLEPVLHLPVVSCYSPARLHTSYQV
jgi:hypothetical protein